MEIPTTLKIGPFEYRVETDNERLRDEGYLGETFSHKLLIQLRQDVAFGQLRESLLHEVLHAISSTYLPADSRPLETAIYSLSAGIAQVLLDNADFTRLFLVDAELDKS